MSESSKIMENLGVDDSLINKILPDHCLAHVFSFLSIRERLDIEKVCKRWCIISEEGWHDIKEFVIDHDEYSEDEIHIIMKRCGRFLRRMYTCMKHPECECLSIHCSQLDQLEEIGIMMSRGNAIKELWLSMSNLRELFRKTRKSVAVIFKGDLTYYRANNLSSLNVDILRIKHTGNSFYLMSINPDEFPNLKELNLKGAKIIEDEMGRTKESLKGLEKLDIVYSYISRNFIQRIGTFTNLQELRLGVNYWIINNEHIRNIASHCYKIKRFLLCGLKNTITSECFQYLGKMLSLEVLYLERFKNVNDSDISHLTNVCQLFIRKCEIINDDGFLELIVNSSNLEKLQILDVEKSLCRRFLEGVGRIFHGGQREKHLLLIISVVGEVQSFSALKKEIDHPLLDLKVSNKPPKMMDYDHDL